MPSPDLILLWLALLSFLIGIINPQPPGSRTISWIALGLALMTLTWLIRGK